MIRQLTRGLLVLFCFAGLVPAQSLWNPARPKPGLIGPGA